MTDRDIVIRGLARSGHCCDANMRLAAIMSSGIVTCHADQDVRDAADLMGERRIRRLVVIDRAGRLVGILSLGDITENVSEDLAGQGLGEVSEIRASDEWP